MITVNLTLAQLDILNRVCETTIELGKSEEFSQVPLNSTNEFVRGTHFLCGSNLAIFIRNRAPSMPLHTIVSKILRDAYRTDNVSDHLVKVLWLDDRIAVIWLSPEATAESQWLYELTGEMEAGYPVQFVNRSRGRKKQPTR